MEKKNFTKTLVLAFISVTFCMIVLTAATFAWFSSNNKVATSKIEARTGSADVKLLLSGSSTDFSESSASIVQINSTDKEYLLPVSTADLETFVYNPVTSEGMAAYFEELSDEAYIYHGRIYMLAESTESQPGAKLAVYLDESTASGGVLASKGEDQTVASLVNASRLGLVFENKKIILRVTENQNEESARVRNTVVGGVLLEDGKVLTVSNGSVVAVNDPSQPLSRYTVNTDSANAAQPSEPLFEIDLNRVYPLDIYFYIEGCDPDCSDNISLLATDLHIALYGALE